jgi:hypothetical protein
MDDLFLLFEHQRTRILVLKMRQQEEISTRWDLYSQQQKSDILSEFRKRLPDDYYCKATLFEFLNKKLSLEERRGTEDSTDENNRTGKKGINRIISIHFISLALIITAGGIIYGITTGKWSNAFGTAITLLAFISPFAPLTYMAALNRMGKNSDNQSSEMPKIMSSIPLKATRLPNGYENIGDQVRSEEIIQVNSCAITG